MKFYIMRHGQTLFNIMDIIQGWTDSPLTEKGIEQAKAAHEKIDDIEFDAVYSSSSERAIDTITYALNGRDYNVIGLKGLKEINFGTMDGQPNKLFFETLKYTFDDLERLGGESRPNALARFKRTLDEISKKHAGNVLIGSHGGIMADLLDEIAPAFIQNRRQTYSDSQLWIPNTAVLEVEYDGDTFKFIQMI